MAASLRGSRQFSFYAAVFLADHVPELLEKGQWRMADEAVVACFQELTRWMRPGDRIYRWAGSALLVLMERDAATTDLSGELDDFPGHLRRRLFALRQYPTPSELSHRIDWYVATNLLTTTKIPA